jgi:integrase
MSPQYRRKLSRGDRWYFKFDFKGKVYFSEAIFATKEQAKNAEARKRVEVEEQHRNPVIDMSLIDLCNQRLDYIQLKKSAGYYQENQRYFKKIIAEWGDIRVSEITKKAVNELVMKEAKRLKAEKRSNHKVNAMIRILKALFNYGIRIHDLSIRNPVFGIEMYSIDVKLKYVPSDEEISATRDTLSAEQRLLFDFVDQTGCRIQEAVRFRYDDVDGDLITLYTRKSKNSNMIPRRIPRPACLNGLAGTGKVFKDWNSYPRFLDERVKWSWHCLRHRRASIWAKEGMPTIEIMARLGHNNLATTMRYLQILGYTRA